MVLTIYTHPLSQSSRAVLMLCRAARIPYVEKQVDLSRGENQKPWFRKLNPKCEVPVIRDETIIRSESVAILRYLVRAYEVNEHWYPNDPGRRSEIDRYLVWHQGNLSKKITNLYNKEVLESESSNNNVVNLESDLESLQASLTFLETEFLKDKEYLFGEEVSIADLLAISEIMQPNLSGRDVLKNHPKLRQWFDLVRATLTPVFDEVHVELFRARDRFIAKRQEKRREEKLRKTREIRRRESTEPEGEVIIIDLDDNIKPETIQNGASTS